jgi:hypothetical protein
MGHFLLEQSKRKFSTVTDFNFSFEYTITKAQHHQGLEKIKYTSI